MADRKPAKDTKGSHYASNAEFAEEMTAKNAKRPAQNKPSISVKK